jgi:hypothetical protein
MKSVYVEHSVEDCKKFIDEVTSISIDLGELGGDGFQAKASYKPLKAGGYEVTIKLFSTQFSWMNDADTPLSASFSAQGKVFLVTSRDKTQISWEILFNPAFRFVFIFMFLALLFLLLDLTLTEPSLFSIVFFGFFLLLTILHLVASTYYFYVYRRGIAYFLKQVFRRMGINNVEL